MANFTVRLELSDLTPDQIQKIHKTMDQAGFHRFLQGDDGRRYSLPTGEFDYVGLDDWTASEVHAIAHAISKTVAPGIWVLVTKSAGRMLVAAPVDEP